ncbi:hypothetical protein N658DRAFT_482042 [Parathielavia hyrcaniae]|uniref:Glycine-rich cell wall structural protein 1 n=1 Tax=Parathielavia hyrcaniae TaxID=113614 RepID=A0AAN6T620_9PEZI|nr:hypothetical protein N658DRAFT_482042 [Parathielavia hyrcaniae]
METINNIANAASKVIWGEGQANKSGQEPISGKMGNVEAGEPYDAGNIGEPNGAGPSSLGRIVPGTEESPSDPASGADKVANSTAPTTATTTTGTSSPLPMPKPEPEAASKEHFAAGAKDGDEQSTATGSTAGPAKFPSSALPMRGDSTKAQNDTRPPPLAASSPEDKADTKKEEKKSQPQSDEDVQNAEVDVKGPGPRPLAEVAREHGGDAGNSASGTSGSEKSSDSILPGVKKSEGERREEDQEQQRRRDSGKGLGEAAQGGGGGDGDAGVGEHGGGKMGGGTGEHYHRSSGLAAEGGDFDASKPGAGREADRLLEQKGVHREVKGHGDHGHGADTDGGKEKVHLKDKIKAKLHMNHNHSSS